jgi:tetratricopeptide (TPR) repeat protein
MVAKSLCEHYYGSAIGALQECFRLYFSIRAKLLYWMGRLYQLAGDKFEAFLCWSEALSMKNNISEEKYLIMTAFIRDNRSLATLHSYHLALKKEKVPLSMKFIFNKNQLSALRKAEPFVSELLYSKMLWILEPEDQSANLLLENLIHKFPYKMDAYLLLWQIYKKRQKYTSMARVSKKMILICTHSQVLLYNMISYSFIN